MNPFALPIRLLAHQRHSIFIFHKVPQASSELTPNEMVLASFERRLDQIAENFKVVPLEESITNFRNRRWKDRLASITFDDGYPEWVQTVLPALQKRNLPATFFITTGQFFGTPLWHERIIHAITQATLPILSLTTPKKIEISLATQADKIAAICQLEAFAKYLPLATRDLLLAELEDLTGASIKNVPTMSTQDLRHLHNLGHGIGAHTDRHPILTQCDEAIARDEIARPREILAEIVGGTVDGFAYPNGIPGKDFSPVHIEFVKRAGYRFAVTTAAGVADKHCSPYQLPRFTPWGPSITATGYQIARNLLNRPAHMPEDGERKKVLMVAFHFPPQAGSSGIQRTLNFVKHLPGQGWQPTVLTAVETAYEKTQSDLDNTIPAGTQIARAFALDTARHLSISGKYLRLMAVPDRWVTWFLGGWSSGKSLTRREQPKLIWTTYPLATANLIGGQLARQFKLPWVADFRDPMIVSATYPADPLERWAKQRIEAFTMRHATRCVFTTANAADLYKSRYPFAADKFMVIPNGFDNDAFEGVVPERHGTPADALLLLHSGIIYPKERDPTTFFTAVNQLIEAGQLARDKIVIRFRGSQNDAQIAEAARQCGLENVVELAPPIPFRAAIAEMAGADILLVFQGSQFNPQVPAKIYEYLRAGAMVFGILDHQGNAAAELRKFAGTALADIESSDEIARELMKVINEQLGAERKARNSATNHELLFTFSRSAQTQRLAQLFEELVQKKSTID